MKHLSLFILMVLLARESYGQSTCTAETIMDLKGGWKKQINTHSKFAEQLQLTSRIAAISDLFKAAYPAPKGLEASWYSTINGEAAIKNGPLSYAFNSFYLGWYCTQGRLVAADETGTWAYAFVNDFSWFLSSQYDLLQIKVNNSNVYLLPPEKNLWKGYSVYQSFAHGNKGRCIVLTHGNRLPWKAVTQEQYLQSVRRLCEKQQKEADNGYSKYETNLNKGISEVKNNNSLKQADKDKMMASLQKDLENHLERKAADTAKINKYWNDKFSLIDTYIRNNAIALQQPAVIDRKFADGFPGNFSTLEKGGQLLVSIDTAYFNKTLPAYAAQFIVLYWRWDNDAPGLYFKKEFEEKFPVEALKAMIDK
jgi:hypothetical protein